VEVLSVVSVSWRVPVPAAAWQLHGEVTGSEGGVTLSRLVNRPTTSSSSLPASLDDHVVVSSSSSAWTMLSLCGRRSVAAAGTSPTDELTTLSGPTIDSKKG